LPASQLLQFSVKHEKSKAPRLSGDFSISSNLTISDEFLESLDAQPSFRLSASVTSVPPTATNLPFQTLLQTEALDSELATSLGFTQGKDEQDGKSPTPAGKPTDLGLILGIVFGVLLLIALVVGFAIYKIRTRKEETAPQEDPNTEFYWLQQREQENEMSAEFTNPVFDEETRVGGNSDDFAASSDEMV
jgi:hypothetical protein